MITKLNPHLQRRTRFTLARRLSVLFVLLLTFVVGTFGAWAYYSVREAASQRATERLASLARELGAGASRTVLSRANTMRVLRKDSTIRTALLASIGRRKGSPSGEDVSRHIDVQQEVADRPQNVALDSIFEGRRSAADSALLGWYVINESGEQLYGEPLAPRDSLELATTVAAAVRGDTVAYSELYASESQIRSFAAAPVKVDDRIIGAIALNRKIIGSDSIEGVIKRLSGLNASVAYTSRGSKEWSSVRGQLIPSPLQGRALEELPDTGTIFLETEGVGEPFYAASAGVTGTPWRIVLTEGQSSILARPRALLGELMLIAVSVLMLGTLGAWWLSRLETRPLVNLRNAADAMANGDYSQVVTPAGAEETSALADAFNTMSMHISDTHATLAERNQELLRANEAKARFLAVMSHELRTPLNAIGGYAELIALGMHGPTTEEQRQALERIIRSKDHLVHLVSDILSFSRLEATPLALACQPVAVMAQFNNVHDTVAEQFARKGVELVMKPSDAMLSADPVRVQQILINLITNALQFTPSGGRVSVYAEEKGDMTTLFVRDTGEGIAAEQQSSIFEPFVQGDSTLTRRSGGAGLGLAIVRQLATAMNGEVYMESALGVGSTFSVTLPSAAMPYKVEDDLSVFASVSD